MGCKPYFATVLFGAIALLLAGRAFAADGPSHAIAMHGEPELTSDYGHMPYALPAAPKGGRIAFGAPGGFDSLNPFALRGRAPWEVRAHTIDSLMARNWDEPFSLYALIAESVETPPDRSWVAFELNPAARFSDGSPVTAEDVLWSFSELGEKGPPGFRSLWAKVASAEIEGRSRLRFTFSEPDREAPLILALAPVLKRDPAVDLGAPTMTPLVASGAYVVAGAEPGRTLTLRRNPDYWARDLPARRGQANFDEIVVEYFRDAEAHRDAFRAGVVDVYREPDPVRWRTGYAFARSLEGDVRKAEIPHQRPSGMYGLAFNTRRAPFDDIRVRRALTLAFNFEWINETLFAGAYDRITAYFDNSPLRHRDAAEGLERDILAPFADSLPEGALDREWAPPTADPGELRNRRNLREAARLLQDAGWTVRDGALRDVSGRPFRFEILLGESSDERVVGVFADALRTLGIEAEIRTVDAAQFQARRTDYDYDMTVNRWALSLSPGNEQRLYWGRYGVDTAGTRNYAGVDSAAVEASIDALLAAREAGAFEAAVRALDRSLSHGVYVIPFWHDPVSRIAADVRIRWPDDIPLYGDWIGWGPDVWWSAEEEKGAHESSERRALKRGPEAD